MKEKTKLRQKEMMRKEECCLETMTDRERKDTKRKCAREK